MRLALSLLTVASLLASAGVARADAAAEARFHDELARRHYAARRYEPAAREFMIEQRLAPNPNIVFNIALCFEHLGRAEEAYMYFAEYLGSPDDNADRRAQATRTLASLRPRVALINVESTPPGAAIFVDRRELGQYGVTPRVLALSPGEHRIWVEREGYRMAAGEVSARVGEQGSLALSPEQILGRLQVRAATDAAVRVLDAEGSLVWEGHTPVDVELAPNTYQVEATAGDERWSEPLSIRPDATTEATAALTGPTGEVTVTANLQGALVALDGHDRGFTPQVLAGVPVGEHELEVRAEGMRTWSGPVDIVEGDRAWLTVELEPETQTGISPFTWAVGGVTVAALVAAAITTGFAVDTHNRFMTAMQQGMPQTALAAESDALNLTADVLWLTAGLGAVASIVLFFTTTNNEGAASRASVNREGANQ